MVFKSKADHRGAALRYFCLAVVQMCISALLVSRFYRLLPGGSELLVKIPVDVLLFFVSFQIQRVFVYKK